MWSACDHFCLFLYFTLSLSSFFSVSSCRRLETIFEVPHKRRDGSHCLLGQKRVKRFVEFPELGKVRKLRKPLVTPGICSSTQKTGGQSSGGRPRRGAWSSFKDDSQPSPEDLDSLLCSKLDQLDSLMAADDGTSWDKTANAEFYRQWCWVTVVISSTLEDPSICLVFLFLSFNNYTFLVLYIWAHPYFVCIH